MLLGHIFFYISTLWSMCAVISTAVYCSCLISCFPGMLLRYFLQDFDMVPVAPYYYPSITDVFFCIPNALYCYCEVFFFKYIRLLSWSRFNLLKLQCPLTDYYYYYCYNYYYYKDSYKNQDTLDMQLGELKMSGVCDHKRHTKCRQIVITVLRVVKSYYSDTIFSPNSHGQSPLPCSNSERTPKQWLLTVTFCRTQRMGDRPIENV